MGVSLEFISVLAGWQLVKRRRVAAGRYRSVGTRAVRSAGEENEDARHAKIGGALTYSRKRLQSSVAEIGQESRSCHVIP